jgi:MFS family permease
MTEAPPPAPDEAWEEVEDAYLEGDRPFAPGTARSALSHRDFRTVYLGAFSSNIGTWMQNVVLGALAWDLTRSGVFVGIVTAAQLGPMLLLSMVGGMLADALDRRRMLIVLSIEQAFFSVLLALVVAGDDPNRVALVLVVLGIGIGNALYAPTFSAVVPILVPKEDIGGAVSLNSVQMNASRVIGPAIGSLLFTAFGPSWVFTLNALSYGLVIVALLMVHLPRPRPTGAQGLHRLLEGISYARAHRQVAQVITTVFIFSFLALPFVTQLPKLAHDNLGIESRSVTYGLLYAAFGCGAVVGALSIGTTFASRDLTKITRAGLLGYALVLATFGLLRAPVPAFPVIFLLGAVYFAVITSLSTLLQRDLDDSVRGKVMALWIMGFGGTVPFGGLLGGWIAERSSITVMVLFGAAVAVALALTMDFRPDAPARPGSTSP